MKTRGIIISLILLFLLVISCKKNEFKNDISGSWNYVNASGGIAPSSIDIENTILQIKKNYHYFIYRNDSLKASGTYSLSSPTVAPTSGVGEYAISFDFKSTIDYTLHFPFNEPLFSKFISKDTLILSTYWPDDLQYLFIKQ